MQNLIAFVGYGGAGKDEAARALIDAGYERRCFGDIIKGQCDELIRRHLGFSAFTEDREQKAKIRRTLESFGEDNYDNIFTEFFGTLPARCVNTRLCRLKEAREWLNRGGAIVEVIRPGVYPETEWARDRMRELRQAKVITHQLENSSDVPALHANVRLTFGLESAGPTAAQCNEILGRPHYTS